MFAIRCATSGWYMAKPSAQIGSEKRSTTAPASRERLDGAVDALDDGGVAVDRVEALVDHADPHARRRRAPSPRSSGRVAIAPRTHCGSRQSSPAIASSSSAAPRTLAARAASRGRSCGRCDRRRSVGTRPCVALMQTTPQYAAGMRPLPPWSTPSARSTAPERTAEPAPPDEPPARARRVDRVPGRPDRAHRSGRAAAELVHVQRPDDRARRRRARARRRPRRPSASRPGTATPPSSARRRPRCCP